MCPKVREHIAMSDSPAGLHNSHSGRLARFRLSTLTSSIAAPFSKRDRTPSIFIFLVGLKAPVGGSFYVGPHFSKRGGFHHFKVGGFRVPKKFSPSGTNCLRRRHIMKSSDIQLSTE
jgi:hypothetical protein